MSDQDDYNQACEELEGYSELVSTCTAELEDLESQLLSIQGKIAATKVAVVYYKSVVEEIQNEIDLIQNEKK
jgi:peptidoglycan hydrolase CwlO-like protein